MRYGLLLLLLLWLWKWLRLLWSLTFRIKPVRMFGWGMAGNKWLLLRFKCVFMLTKDTTVFVTGIVNVMVMIGIDYMCMICIIIVRSNRFTYIIACVIRTFICILYIVSFIRSRLHAMSLVFLFVGSITCYKPFIYWHPTLIISNSIPITFILYYRAQLFINNLLYQIIQFFI